MTIEEKYALALQMLADWVNMVLYNGTQWDDWDEGYKDAYYRPCPIRDDLDQAIKTSKEQYIPWAIEE